MKNLIIDKIIFYNFKCFSPGTLYTYTFNENLTILSGPNGFGKTTIFDAIELIFSHNMTRFNSPENGLKKFEEHILLNDSSKKGLILLETICEEEKVTFGCVISSQKGNKPTDLQQTITYFKIGTKMNTEQEDADQAVNNFISMNKLEWEVCESPLLKHFNINYYVSQETSTHFLKETIKKRRDILSPLIGIEEFNEKFDRVKLDIFKENLDSLEIAIQLKEDEVRRYYQNSSLREPVTYKKIFDNKQFLWDDEKIPISYFESYSKGEELEERLKCLEQSILYKEDLAKFSKQSELSEILKQEDAKTHFVKIKTLINQETNVEDYIKNGISDNDILQKIINYKNKFNEIKLLELPLGNTTLNKLENIFNQTKLYFEKNEIQFLSQKNQLDIKAICEDTLSVLSDLSEKNDKRNEDSNIKNSLNANRKMMTDKLKTYTNIISSENNDKVHCPLCYKEYKNLSDLLKSVKKLDPIVADLLDEDDKLIDKLTDKVLENNKKILNIMNEILLSKQLIINETELFDNLKNETGLQRKVINIDNFFVRNSIKMVEMNTIEFDDLLEREREKEEYSEEFISNYDLFAYNEKLFEFFETINPKEFLELIHQLNIMDIRNKMTYIAVNKLRYQNQEYQTKKNELKVLYKERIQINEFNSCMTQIKEIVVLKEKELKASIVENIKVPLLIYTAKLLQNYQGGLGVYCDESELRFISASGQHDIINKFSSGQLSAFVLTFLLVMNKTYVDKDAFPKFLFIDDPVQTMDDINLSSFVDVLRREFSDKQIFLSTHEIDKKNYIAYKFIKNNIPVSIFDVKEEWYA